MNSEKWAELYEVQGSFQAEILRGLLEAQGIRVLLSQEGAGHNAFAVNVGPLGRVEILVPQSQMEDAQQVLEDYRSGAYEMDELESTEGTEGEEPEA